MSVVTGRRFIGAFSVLMFVLLFSAVANAAVPAVTVYAPASVTVGSGSPFCVLVQDSGVPMAGVTVAASVATAGSVAPATAVTNASGYASFTYTAPTAPCAVTITASSGGVQATADVRVRAGPPVRGQLLTPPGLLPANGYCIYHLEGQFFDRYGNGCDGWPVDITIDGVNHYVVNTGSDGKFTYDLGPRSSKHTYSITARANVTLSTWARFLDANLYLTGYSSNVPSGQNVTITATLLDDLTPAPGILLTFNVYSPNDQASPSLYSGYTDENGMVDFTFMTSPKAGLNTVSVSNQSLGGNLDFAYIQAGSGSVSQIVLASDPVQILADGNTPGLLKIWAKDSGGNPVRNEALTVVRNYMESYSPPPTNSNGYTEVRIDPSIFTGTVHYDVTAQNGVTTYLEVTYVPGPAAMTVIKANPNVVASSDVPQPGGMTNIHRTQITAQVTDAWYHPLSGYGISVSSLNTTAGTIDGNTSGITDENGMFYTYFLLGDKCIGTGSVNVRATSGSLSSTYPITYTNVSFLSVSTDISPRNVSINGTMNVDIQIKGLGWNNRPLPVDMMLITDRSGSMDWYATVLDSMITNAPYTGKDFLVDTYSNTRGYKYLQFMLSSPYTNYDLDSYYYGLKVSGPGYSGNKTGTQSANENYYQFTDARTGTYKVYARATLTPAGGNPPYSYAVLTKPKRLGSPWVDNDSAAKTAAVNLAHNMTAIDQMGLVSFSTSGSVDAQLKFVGSDNDTANLTRLTNAINGLDANGGTNLSAGIMKAIQEYSSRGRSTAKHVAILLSDGYSQYPEFDEDAAIKAKDKGIVIFTIGMGMADMSNLAKIAHITGGDNFTVTSSQELTERYQQILKNVTEVVANQSTMDIISTRSVVNGTLTNDTEYIPGSAWVTFVNRTDPVQIEPVITSEGENYTLSWEPGPINCNQIWEVKYQLRAIHGGVITPISNYSNIRFTNSDGNIETINFVTDSIFCRGTADGHVGTSSSTLMVNLTSPDADANLTQLRQMICWLVTYNGSDSYTQHLYILPADRDEWLEIAQGFAGDRSSTGTYSYEWNLERMPPGTYTIQVFATDGTYDAVDERTIKIPYNSGKITLL